MKNDFQIRKLHFTDIPLIAPMLLHTLNGSLLQKLGNDFIQQHFLPGSLSQAGLTNYICKINGQIAGYLLFSRPQNTIQTFGKKMKRAILIYALKRLFKYPGLIIELIFGFFNRVEIEKNYKKTLSNATYLVYFAISPNAQGQGWGSLALSKCLAELPASGCVVETKNPKAIKFYEKNGFKIIGTRKRFFGHCKLLLKTSA